MYVLIFVCFFYVSLYIWCVLCTPLLLGFTYKATQVDKKIGVYAIEAMQRNPKAFPDLSNDNFNVYLEEAIRSSIGIVGIIWNGEKSGAFYKNYFRKYLPFMPCLSIYLNWL